MLSDRLAEGGALLRVTDRGVEGGLADPNRARGNIDPTDLQRAHDLLEAFAFASADEISSGDLKFLELDLAGIDTFVTELLQLAADGGASFVLFDREHADSGIGRFAFGSVFAATASIVPLSGNW